MSIPKRQHTVPSVYLKNFVDGEGRLTVWSKRRKTTLRPNPDDALIRRYYYSQPVNGIDNANHSLEIDLLGAIETKYPKLLSAVLSGEKNLDLETLLHTILMLRSRSTAFREPFELALSDLVERQIKSIPESQLPPPPNDYPDIRDHLVVTIDPHRSLQAMAYYVVNYVRPLTRMEWTIRSTPKGKELLTSDNPVVWYERGFCGRLPIIYPQDLTLKTRAVVPVTRTAALVGRRSSTGDMRFLGRGPELSRELVRESNKIQLACAWDDVVITSNLRRSEIDTFGRFAPRMEIHHYEPESGAFLLNRTYLDAFREKCKFERYSGKNSE